MGWVHWELIAGAIREDLDELDIQVRRPLAFTGFGLVRYLHSVTTDFTTRREKVTGPIGKVQDRIIQPWELDPVFNALAADLPERHPGRLILVFEEDSTQFHEGSLIRVWRWVVVGCWH